MLLEADYVLQMKYLHHWESDQTNATERQAID